LRPRRDFRELAGSIEIFDLNGRLLLTGGRLRKCIVGADGQKSGQDEQQEKSAVHVHIKTRSARRVKQQIPASRDLDSMLENETSPFQTG
jgi:hypothetical protein